MMHRHSFRSASLYGYKSKLIRFVRANRVVVHKVHWGWWRIEQGYYTRGRYSRYIKYNKPHAGTYKINYMTKDNKDLLHCNDDMFACWTSNLWNYTINDITKLLTTF